MAKKIRIIPWLDESQLNKQLNNIGKKKQKIKVDLDNANINNANRNMRQLNNTVANSNTVFGKLKHTIGETFSASRLTTTGFLTVLNEINKAGRQAKETIQEIDSAITDLSIATNQSREAVSGLIKDYNIYARELKSTTTQITSAADEYLRSGKTMDEAQALIKDSIMLSKLGQIESTEATENLLAVMNGFSMSVDEVSRALDTMVALDMEASISAGQIATALKYCSSSADAAGISFDALASMISVTREKTMQSAEVIGSFFNTVLSRYRDVKIGNYITEDGEDISDYESVLKSVGIQLRTAEGEFRDFETVLGEMATKWDSLSSVQQAALAKVASGTRQQNRFYSLMQGYNKVLELTETAASSAGTAVDKFQNSYSNSLEAKQNELQAAFESMVINSDFDEVYSGIIDATTALVDFINQTNALKGVMTGLTVSMGIKAFLALKTGINESYIALNKFSNALNIVKQTRISTADFDKLLLLTNGLSDSQMKMVLSSKSLSMEQKELLLVNSGLSMEEARLKLQTLGLTTAQTGLTAATTTLGNAFKGLIASMAANPIMLVTMLVSGAVMAYQSYNQKLEETRQKNIATSETAIDHANSLKDLYTEYSRLSVIQDKSSSEEEEFKTAIEDVTKALGDKADVLEGLTAGTNEYAEAQQNFMDGNKDNNVQLSISSTVEALNTKLKPAIDSLSSAYQDIFTSDGFTRENIGLSMFDSIKSELDEMSEAGLEIDLSSFENLVTVLNDTESTSTQIKDAFDQMAYSIANAAVSGLEDFGVLKESLKQLGFVEYELAAFESLVQNTEALKEAGLDLATATEEQITAFANEMVSAENASQAFNILTFAKELYNLQTMDTSDEVANLLTLAENAGYTGDVIKYLTELEMIYQEVASGTLAPGALTGKLARADVLKGLIEASAAKINFAPKEDVIDWKPLEKSASKAGKSAGEEYKDALEDELSNPNDVISYVNDIIGDQIDLFEDQKDAAVDALEAERDAAIEALEAQKDLLQEKIDGLNDEIDKIKEAREERQAEIDLQKKQYDLERLQNQKTSLVYKTGNDGVPGQMVYEHDIQGVRDAREAVDEAKEEIKIIQIEKEIRNLEDVIEGIESQIESTNKMYDEMIKNVEKYYDNLIKGLEEYQSRWDDLLNIEKEAKMKVALQELNITTDDILNMSGDAFEAFKQQYLAILTEMYSGEEQMINAINEAANGINMDSLSEGLNKTKENIDNLNNADFNSVSTGLNNVSTGMSNVGTSASTASTNTSAVSDDLQEINTNTEGLDTKLNNISSALTNMPDGSKFDGLADLFINLGEAIEGVVSALGIGTEETVSGLVSALNEISTFSLEGGEEGNGIIAQFQNLKSAVDEVTSAINGGVSSSNEADASNSSSPSMSTGNSGSGQNGLTGAIKEIGTTTDTTLGTGGGEGEDSGKEGSEGVIGKFSAFKTAVDEVTKAIGTGEEEQGSGEEGASSLIGALQLHYEKAEETLPEVKTLFEDLLVSIEACVSALNNMVSAMSSMGELSIGGGVSLPTHAEGTVGKAFAKGTGKYKGLPHDEKNALRSEYGQPELTVYPDGTTELTTEPTMSDLPKDTVIFNEEQTKRIMNNEGTVLGNAYLDGNVVLKKTPLPDYLRPLQEGDKGYELTKKFLAHQGLLIGQIMPPVNAIERNMEMLTRNISNVNTSNNINRPTYSINGGLNITCPGVTSEEVAKQLAPALEREFFGMSNRANQKMNITR